MVSIKFRKNPTSEELHAFELRNRLTEARNRKEFFILRDIPVAQAINEIWNDSLVWNAYAVKGGPLRIRGTMGRIEPTDPYWMNQWNLHQNRAATDTNHVSGDDSRDFDVDSPEGWWLWNQGPFADSAVIAIIDIGFRADHIDLTDKWRRNPTEIVDGADNDGNGYVDDEYGWSFRTNSPVNSSTTTVGNIDDDMLSSGINLESDAAIERADSPEVRGRVDTFTRAM